jgi:hypothetical protein
MINACKNKNGLRPYCFTELFKKQLNLSIKRTNFLLFDVAPTKWFKIICYLSC